MANNTTLNLATTGDVISDDQITSLNGGAVATGEKVQRMKLAYGAPASATDATLATPFPTTTPNASITGTFTAVDAVVAAPIGDGTIVTGTSTAGSIVALALPSNMSAWIIMLKVYTTGTVYSEASPNSTNGTDGDWVEIKGRKTGTAPGIESVGYAFTSAGIYRGNAASFTWFRLRYLGTFTAGMTALISLSHATGAVFLNSGIPAGSSLLGKMGIDQTTPGTTNLVASNTSTAITSVVTILQNATAATNNGTSLIVTGYGTAVIQITGTFVATINFEFSIDGGTTWNAISATQIGAGDIFQSTTIPGSFRITCTALDLIRARVTWTSGSVTINGRASNAINASKVVKLASGTNTIGKAFITDGTNSVGITSASIGGNETTVDRLKVNASLRVIDTAQTAGTQLVGLRGDQTTGLWVNIKNTSIPVTGTFFQATQPVSIATTVPVSGTFFQATQPISGTVAANATLSPETTKVIGTVNVAGTVPVSGTFFQATQPVSLATNTPTLQAGSTTAVTQATAANLNATVVGTVTANAGTGTMAVSLATNTPTLAAGTNLVGKFGIDQTTQGVTNAVSVTSQPELVTTGTITTTDIVVAAPSGTGALLSGTSTAGSYVAMSASGGNASVVIGITGLTTGTIYYEGSADSTTGIDGNWITLNMKQAGVVNTQISSFATTNGLYRGNTAGIRYIRMRSVGTLTGTPAITLRLSSGVAGEFLFGSIPTGTNSIGTVVLTAETTKVIGTVNVAGTVPVSGTFFQATQPVSIATMPTTQVTGTFFQTTQPVSLVANTPVIAAGTNKIGSVDISGSVPITTTAAAALNADLVPATDVSAYKSVTIQLSGTWSATIVFQGSNDNVTFLNIVAENINTTGGSMVTSTTLSNVFYHIPIKFKFLRIRMTAFTSGTATSTAIAYTDDRGVNTTNVAIGSGSSIGLNVSTTNIGGVLPRGTNVNGNTLSTLNAAATTNATLLKASAATVYTITIMNASAANRFVRIYNLTTAPTVGTSIPIMVIAVPATSSKELEFGMGIPFSVGLSFAITAGAAATDATVVAAGDVQLTISWN